MSLNGLDDASVTQAYQGALAEAGGWLLLKYASRDAVEVLKQGTGGAGEVRAAVAQYEEKSPLYGFMLYRRRKVLVKYLPEGTSRLLQARVAVHFITVTERFSPHDFVLAVSTPDELSDAALTAACTLHTAAPSSSSSSGSSRAQKLSWIQEAAEEGSMLGGDDSAAAGASRPGTAKSVIPTIVEPIEEVPEMPPTRVASMMSDSAMSVPLMMEVMEEKAPPVPRTLPEITHVTIEKVTETPPADQSDLTDMQDTLKSYDKLFENGPEPRSSSQTARPNYDELYEHYYAQYSKPKVKLGPRPRPSMDGKRPSTSGSVPQVGSRPKSSLPAGLRSATRKAADERAVKASKDSQTVPSLALPPPPPIPAASEPPSSPISLAFTARSPASVRSMPVSSYSSHHRSTGMTQEKTRLMKALEMRKKQMKVQIERQEKLAEQAVANSQAEAREAESKAADAASIASKHEDTAEDTEAEKQSTAGDDTASSLGLDNSGLAFASNSIDEEQSVDSLPTVVPESRTPIPSMIHTTPPPTDDEQTSEGAADLQTREVDMAQSTISDAQDDSQAHRRSKRESMLFVPTGDASPLDDSKFKKRNRESIIMPTPIQQTPNHKKRQSWYETKGKRPAPLDALHVSAENSEAEYLSDDSFMEELQSATVQEAKPMSVSKSPITPYFSRKSFTRGSMTPESSSPYMKPSPEPMPRKISGPWPPQVNVEKVAAKKINVSSGISQRIKALAEKTSREMLPPTTPGGGLDSSSHSSLAQRKSSFFATTPIETSPNGRPVSRLGNPAFLNSSSTTPEKKSIAAPKPIKATVYNVQRGSEQPESVQVTARIVRDERTKQPTLAMPNEGAPLELHQSPLIIDHQKPRFTPPPTRGRTEPTSPVASSIAHSRDQSLAPSRTSSESAWRPFGRRMSESRSIHSHDGDEKREDKKDKKESRTSKMFKRMSSSMSSMPWKASTSNLSFPEHNTAHTSLASLREPPSPVHIGDLNIQFPDTLLWKRRYVEIDSMGNLVLSPSKSNEKGIVKRFHLSEFRAPYPPDQDRQELPNSVVLDFVDGRCLQCACETYMAQAHVLQILREAHDAWLAYNQTL
ncbi:hypothetical protein SNOG_10110 [Parastagonospora nodorum SN15]|uniref:ADF-H domain-containing protein n=1 Tax=Phaeosphaeria nodorum (strain SN15 / ATCC MYA-4574 / FGSC 10173) TaxID=321614 RepID=Q0UDQ4_PHANO|nr:hypothetical protein SNOG_10110 [Parastagonospora nodorum SN15]EAT82445.2 hypothetical protein SNOG_10110 [Parastagonospora nodorum SN15]